MAETSSSVFDSSTKTTISFMSPIFSRLTFMLSVSRAKLPMTMRQLISTVMDASVMTPFRQSPLKDCPIK